MGMRSLPSARAWVISAKTHIELIECSLQRTSTAWQARSR